MTVEEVVEEFKRTIKELDIFINDEVTTSGVSIRLSAEMRLEAIKTKLDKLSQLHYWMVVADDISKGKT